MAIVKNKHTVLIWMAGFMLAFFLSVRVFNDGTPGWKSIITSDGRGYYAYLPALLIDHDLTFAGVAGREARLLGIAHYRPGYLVKPGDRTLNKYFAGESLLLLPFFVIATLCSYLAGTAVDGYSFFFQVFAGLGTLFYLFLGLLYLGRILEKMKVRISIAAITLFVILFGTNLFYYSLWQPSMSHVFSFFAINGFMWYTMKAIGAWNVRSASLMAFFLGVTCLVRPTNAIVILLIPFLAEDHQALARFTRSLVAVKAPLFLFVFIVSSLFSIQCLLWYLQTGQWFVWSYRDEGFNFSQPEIFNVLFSYRKGLFVYTPLLLFSIPGIFTLAGRKWMQFFSVTAFMGAGTWIIASWWNWYYGDGFGLRAFIDYYGVFAILLALVMDKVRQRAVPALWAFLVMPFTVLSFVQTWQYTHRVIQPNSMNSAKYHYVFMRTDSAVINCLGGNSELPDHNIDKKCPEHIFFNTFEREEDSWSPNCIINIPSAFSGSNAGYLDSAHQFSPGIAVTAGELGSLPSAWFIRGDLMVRDSVPGASNGALVVLSMDSINPGENWWQGFRLNDIPVENAGTWTRRSFSLMTPVFSNPQGIFKVYIWNTGKKPLLIDDFSVMVYGRQR